MILLNTIAAPILPITPITPILPILAGIGLAIIWYYIVDMPFRIKLLLRLKPHRPVKGLDCLFCTATWFSVASVALHHYLTVPNFISIFLAIIAMTKLYTYLIETK